MDNLFPVGISSIAGMLKKHKIDFEIFDTTYYPNDGISCRTTNWRESV